VTDLRKIVKRRTMRELEHNKKRLIVSFEPGDTLSVREEGRRTTYRAPLEKVYWMMAKWHAAEAVREKAKEKKLRKAFRESIVR